MNFHRCAIERTDLHLDLDNLQRLHGLEDPCQYSSFGPAAHPRIDGMPMTVFFWQPPPFRPVFCNVEDRIENFQITVGQAAAMLGKAVGDTIIVGLAQAHLLPYQPNWQRTRFTLTRPNRPQGL